MRKSRLPIILAILLMSMALLAACADESADDDGNGEDDQTDASDGDEEPDADAGEEDTAEEESPDYPEMEVSINSSLPPSHVLTSAGEYFGEQLVERSGGAIEVDWTHSGSLIGAADEINSLSNGVIDVGSIISFYHEGITNFMGAVATLPYKGNLEQVAEIGRRTHDLHAEEAAEQGIHLLMFAPSTTDFYFTEEVPCGDPDWDGLRVRVFGGYSTDVVEEFGGSPQFIASTEIPSAMGAGLLDGFATSLQTWHGSGQHEFAPFVCYTHGNLTVLNWYGINQDFWDSLDADTQALFEEIARDTEVWATEESAQADVDILEAVADDENVTVYEQTEEELAAIREQLAPIWDKFVDEHGAAAEEVLEVVEEVSGQ